jgi:hypothetical protein
MHVGQEAFNAANKGIRKKVHRHSDRQVSWLSVQPTRRAFPEGKRSFFALAVSRFASARAAYHLLYASALQLTFLARTKNPRFHTSNPVAWLRLSSLITVAGQRRIFTFFPIISPADTRRPVEHLNE